MSLTREQRAAIDCDENILLRACPGSGKTRVITTKLMASIDDVRGTPRKIACITYTNSAVHEIEDRVAKTLMPDDDGYFDVSTIHSFCLANVFRPFCWRVPGYERGFKLLTREMDDFEPLVNAACAEFNYLQPRHQDYEDFSGLNIDVDGNAIGSALTSTIVARGAAGFWRRCRERGYIDFCNLLFYSLWLLRTYPEIADGVASRYALILIDEFQDTTDVQVEILTEIATRQSSRFFLVGDTYQSIYGFAGARPELADVFAARVNARCDFSLSGNFRSSEPIIADAERLFPRSPPMKAVGDARIFKEATQHFVVADPLHAITDYFLPTIESLGIPLGEATVLAPSWNPLFPLSRQLRDMGVSVVGPGARPYRRGRLFAGLAEQLCGYIVDPRPDSLGAIERGLFHLVQDVTGHPRFGIFSYAGRVVVMKILEAATRLAAVDQGALRWLDETSEAVGHVLADADLIAPSHIPLLFTSVQEMKGDMRRNRVDATNYTLADLGLFASPQRALKLSTLHFAKGREFDAVAMIKLHEGAIPFFLATTAEDFEAARRLFYVGVTRARRLLMYITDTSDSRNRPTRFLGPDGVGLVG
jgi:DNA helicase-2/ATP-dependent DNA helicase PcrA